MKEDLEYKCALKTIEDQLPQGIRCATRETADARTCVLHEQLGCWVTANPAVRFAASVRAMLEQEGYANEKTGRLKAMVDYIYREHGGCLPAVLAMF